MFLPPIQFNEVIEAEIEYINSSRSFYVSLDAKKWRDFHNSMNSYYKSRCNNSNILININKVYCVMNNYDLSYYRGRVLNKCNDEYLIHLIDIGYEMKVKKNSIFELAPQFILHPLLVVHCYLNDRWTEKCDYREGAMLYLLSQLNNFCTEYRIIFVKQNNFTNKVAVEIMCKSNETSGWINFNNIHFDIFLDKSIPMSKFVFEDFKTNFFNCASFDELLQANKQFLSIYDLNNKVNIDDSSTSHFFNKVSGLLAIKQYAILFTTNLSYFYHRLDQKLKQEIVEPNMLIISKLLDKFYFRFFIYDKINNENLKAYSIDFGFNMIINKNDCYPLLEDFNTDYFHPMVTVYQNSEFKLKSDKK